MARLSESKAVQIFPKSRGRQKKRKIDGKIIQFPKSSIAGAANVAQPQLKSRADIMAETERVGDDDGGEVSLLKHVSLRDFGHNIDRMLAETSCKPVPRKPNGPCRK